MSDVNDIITLVLDDEKLKKSSSFSGKVYGDEPILRPASALSRPAVQQVQRKSNIPGKIMEMRDLPYRSGIYWQSRERIFYEQAKFMEDYEDDCPYTGNFTMYYPTYGSMTSDQLRGYFTWRTAVRKGEFNDAPVSFIFLYIYELLNGVGVGTPEEGFGKLKAVGEHYGGEPVVRSYLRRWIKDYVIYNKLPPELLDDEDSEFDRLTAVLSEREKYGDDELFDAIMRLSAYNIGKSKFYSAFPEDYRTVACGTYRRLADHCDAHNKKTLSEKYFGCRVRTSYYMFRSAVFYERSGRRSFVYDIGDYQRYECVNGMWYADMIQGSRKSSKELGELMRAVDHLMRERYDFRHRLGGCRATKLETDIIEKQIDGIFERKKREEAAKIEIDVSKLNGIRQAADITREKLIVEEETDTAEETAVTTPEPVTGDDTVPDELPLDAAEYGFLRCLLHGGDINAAAAKAGKLPSIIADSINEKLFDIFADTVIDISGGGFEIIEDYTDELKGLIKE